MAVTDANSLAAALAAAQQFSIFKVGSSPRAAGVFHSLWKATGYPVAGSNPGTIGGGIPDRNTAGAIPFSAFGALTGYLAIVNLAQNVSGSILLGDRQWANSTLSAIVTTTQTINGAAVNRGAVGNQLWLEVYSALGATAANLTVNYTNQAGVTGKTATLTIPTNLNAGSMVNIPLAVGDTGVLSVQSVILSASMGVAGDFGLTLIKPITLLSILAANLSSSKGVFDLGIPIVDTNACLMFYILASSTSAATVLGQVAIAQG